MTRNQNRRPQRPPEAELYVDDQNAQEAVRYVHQRMFDQYRPYPQSLFWQAQPNRFVQLYTERRQQQHISHRLITNPNIYTDIYNNAEAVVNERQNRQDDQMEFLNMQGQRVAFITMYWDFQNDAFNQALGSEFRVLEIVQIEVIRENEPNMIIMTLVLDYPPIY